MENRTIQKDLNKTNRPCEFAKPEFVEDEILESMIEVQYQESVEFRALYDFAKFEEQRDSK